MYTEINFSKPAETVTNKIVRNGVKGVAGVAGVIAVLGISDAHLGTNSGVQNWFDGVANDQTTARFVESDNYVVIADQDNKFIYAGQEDVMVEGTIIDEQDELDTARIRVANPEGGFSYFVVDVQPPAFAGMVPSTAPVRDLNAPEFP